MQSVKYDQVPVHSFSTNLLSADENRGVGSEAGVPFVESASILHCARSAQYGAEGAPGHRGGWRTRKD